jgi:gas vesicle protein
MADHVEIMKKQMDDTRTSLADKIEALEDQVTDTVKEATTDVSNTVKTVKETVEEVTGDVKEAVNDVTHTVAGTVEDMAHNVARFVDVSGHVRRHPWIGFGGAIFLGYVAARFLGARREGSNESSRSFREPASLSTLAATPPRSESRAGVRRAPEAPKSAWPQGWVWKELDRLKNIAVGSVLGMVRDLAAAKLPEAISKKICEEVDRVSDDLDAEKIDQPILSPIPPAQKKPDGNGRKTFSAGS